LKDLVRSINSALSAPVSLQPLPDDVVNVIQEYLNRHSNIDEHESQRLHDELLNIHVSRVQGHPDRLAVFLSCFRTLRPAIYGVEHLLKWWEVLVKPTLDSMGQARAVVADARAIVLSVLACDDEDDPTGQKAQASLVFTDKLFEIFLEKTKLPDSAERGAGVKEEQKRRFVSANVEAVLLAYGKRRAQVSVHPKRGQDVQELNEMYRHSSKKSTALLCRRNTDFRSWDSYAAMSGFRVLTSTRFCRLHCWTISSSASRTTRQLPSYHSH
jgi:solute carrier family 25 protein 16